MIITLAESVKSDFTGISYRELQKISELPRTNKEKFDAECWSPFELKLDPECKIGKRSFLQTDKITITILVFDWDYLGEPPELTYTHYRHKTHGDKWRIIVPLKEVANITRDKFKDFYYKAAVACGMPPKNEAFPNVKGFDTKCAEINRFFICPKTDVEIEFERKDSISLDVIFSQTLLEEFKPLDNIKETKVNDALLDRLRKLHKIFKDVAPFKALINEKRCILSELHASKSSHDGEFQVNLSSDENEFSVNVYCYHESCKTACIDVLKENNVEISTDRLAKLRYTEAFLLAGIQLKKWDFDFIEKLYLPDFLNEHHSVISRLKERPEHDVRILDKMFFNDKVIFNSHYIDDVGENIQGDLAFYEYVNEVYRPVDPVLLTDKISGDIKAWYRYKFWDITNNGQISMTKYKEELLSYIRVNGMRDTQMLNGLSLKNGFLKIDRTMNRQNKLELKIDFIQNSRKNHTRKKLDYSYDPEAKCPFFLELLDTYFHSNEDIIKSFQQFCGICLTEWRDYECFAMFYGAPRSGKGTLAETMLKVTGGTTACLKDLLDPMRRGEKHQYKTAFLDEEFSHATSEALGIIKQLTSTTPVACRTLYNPSFTAPSFPKLIFAFNNVPEKFESDDALQARMIAFNFDRSFVGMEDTTLKGFKIPRELPGILNWFIEGLHQVVKLGHVSRSSSTTQRLQEKMAPSHLMVFKALMNKLPMDSEITFHSLREILIADLGEIAPVSNRKLPDSLERFMRKAKRTSTSRSLWKFDREKVTNYMLFQGLYMRCDIAVIPDLKEEDYDTFFNAISPIGALYVLCDDKILYMADNNEYVDLVTEDEMVLKYIREKLNPILPKRGGKELNLCDMDIISHLTGHKHNTNIIDKEELNEYVKNNLWAFEHLGELAEEVNVTEV